MKKEKHKSEWYYEMSAKVIGYPFLIVTFLFLLVLAIARMFEIKDLIERIQYPLLIIVIGTIFSTLIASMVFSAKGSRRELDEKKEKEDRPE